MNPNGDLLYFDNNATTPVDPEVLDAMMPYLRGHYGNPSSVYRIGKEAARAMDTARGQVAEALGCDGGEVVFTSCGTESSNAAIHSALSVDRDRQHLVTTRVEHSATLKTCELLAKRGYEITWLGVDGDGRLDLGELRDAIREDTALVSVMWANNETGVIFPVEEIATIARERGVFLHTDAVQVVGKVPVNLGALGLQFLSLSGHKLHCPKGIGALYVNRRCRFTSYLTGGGQEGGRRAGTENVAYAVGLGKACEIAVRRLEEERVEVRALRDAFEDGVMRTVSGVVVNGDRESRLPNTTSLSFTGVDAETMLLLLDQNGLCCSAGSACTSGSIHPSHVLKAMGMSDDRARSSLRFSFSRFNTRAEVERGISLVVGAVDKVRAG
jgi:cysteine desulfurase